MTAAAFATAWFVHLLAAASPGPSILMAARTGVTEGFRTAVWLCLGLAVGAIVLALAALFGLALLFAAAPALLWAFKIAGGAFLVWIGWKMWRNADTALPDVAGRPGAAGAKVPRSRAAAFRLGLVTQLANPKPAVFFGAVFVTTVPPGTSAGWLVLLLAAIFANEFLCTLAVARAFSMDAARRFYARAKRAIDRVFGGALALLGVRIAVG